MAIIIIIIIRATVVRPTVAVHLQKVSTLIRLIIIIINHYYYYHHFNQTVENHFKSSRKPALSRFFFFFKHFKCVGFLLFTDNTLYKFISRKNYKLFFIIPRNPNVFIRNLLLHFAACGHNIIPNYFINL